MYKRFHILDNFNVPLWTGEGITRIKDLCVNSHGFSPSDDGASQVGQR
jgi:hypothetical protein